MKFYKYIWILLVVVAFVACKEDEPAPIANLVIKDVEIETSYREAEISWRVVCNATATEVLVEYALDSTFTKFEQAKMSLVNPKADDNIYSAVLKPLMEDTQYFLRCRVINKINSYTTGPIVFNTKAYQLSKVQTDSITNITVSSAILHATLIENGSDSTPQVGFCMATHKNATIADSCLIHPLTNNKDSVSYSITIDDLEDNTTYYVRAYAVNIKGVTYGEELNFSTIEIVVPQVGNTTLSDITYTTAIATSEVLDDGGSSIIEHGICYSTLENPTIASNKVASGGGTGAFSCNLTGLTDGTTYFVRAYATNSKGTSYGDEVTFITSAYGLPMVTTAEVIDISYTTAICGGNVTADGGQEVTERGICYATTKYPTISNIKIANGKGIGSFSCNLTGLTAGTTYYIRAYAINSQGTNYGSELIFKTNDYSLPTVTTSAVSNISYTTAICGGNVTADGDQEVTERGICYATTKNPTISNSKITNGKGLGSFTCNLTNLSAGITYYVRAYASNSKGTAYGEETNFTTTAYGMPVVITTSATDITYTTATCGGNVTADGGQTVTERGICYSTSQNPTISNNKIASGSGLGSFTCNLTGLTAEQKYYVRAYASNSKGTSYGNEVSFTTQSTNGAILSEFSVSDTKKVRFSKGNLQYQASTNTWRFATNQYDVIGGENANISSSYAGWIDLFGWCTNGYDNTDNDANAINYHPWSNAISMVDANCNAYGYGPSQQNCIGATKLSLYWTYYEWGNNKISNGGNQTKMWRTLLNSEWRYLISTRVNANKLRGIAMVNGVHGYVILPDDWIIPNGLTWTAEANTWTTNSYSIQEWEKMENNGAIFLPCGGYRKKTTINDVNTRGDYWSFSFLAYFEEGGNSHAYKIYFKEETINPEYKGLRSYGCSVRLVQDVQ